MSRRSILRVFSLKSFQRTFWMNYFFIKWNFILLLSSNNGTKPLSSSAQTCNVFFVIKIQKANMTSAVLFPQSFVVLSFFTFMAYFGWLFCLSLSSWLLFVILSFFTFMTYFCWSFYLSLPSWLTFICYSVFLLVCSI